MADPYSDDWLPPGWTVQVRVRRNGKRDKYYFCPSSGLKFNSRVEVSRYLDKAQNQVGIKRIAENVVVEKGIAEGLPPGWIKKTRITTKGDTIRRDPYYIDPVSGYAFRSIKDVDRYLESGEIGRNAFKAKDKDSSDMDLEDDKFSSAGVAIKPKLSVSRVTQHTVMGQSSNTNGIVNDQQIPKPACAGESVLLSEHNSSHCVTGAELTSSVPSRAECSDEKEGKVGLAESNLVPACTDGVAPEKQLRESTETKHETEKTQNGKRKNRHKKEINLPRRSSKRLAGIKIDPLPELKTSNRARRAAVKQSGEGEAITNEDKSLGSFPNGATKQFNALEGGPETKCKFHNSMNTKESPQSSQSKHSYRNLCTPEKLPVEEYKSEKDQERFSFLPLENQAQVKEHVKDLENEDKVDAKLDFSPGLPLGELLTDPCIAFAIQTLTGVTFETSKNSQISSELSNSKLSETSAAAKGHDKKINAQNMGDWKQGCNVSSPLKNLVIPEHAGDTEIDDKANDNSGSSELPLGISWMDPCIDFAVKTLTGTIPLDYDPNTENCLQQQLCSSNTQGHCEVALSSSSLDNLCQTDYYCNQYLGTQKPVFRQQSFLDPALLNPRNVGLGNSAGARLPQCGEDRRNGCQS